MGCCISDLRSKEVINISDGRRLGCIGDLEFDANSGRIISIMIPCDGRLFGFGRKQHIVILWEDVEKIGDDAVLVKINAADHGLGNEIVEAETLKKRRFFF